VGARPSAISSDSGTSEDGIDEKVVGVTSDLPHVESEQIVVNDEFSLGRERLSVVIGNEQLLVLVVKEGSLAAVVESESDSGGGSAVAVKESLADQGREVDLVRHGFGISALIKGGGKRVRSEMRVINQVSRAVNCVGRSNVIGVAVGGNSEQEL